MSLAQANATKRRMVAAGQVYICPNGERSTVLWCPWPGCREKAVQGWGSCSAHFEDMHPPARMIDPWEEIDRLERENAELRARLAGQSQPATDLPRRA